jgi:hypothetical protein
MGGTNDPMNLIELSIEEHAEAHRELWEFCGRWQDYVAWKCLSGQITCAEAIKEAGRLANTGKKHTEEHKQKIREGVKKNKKPQSKESIENGAQKRRGLKRSDEFKEKMKLAWIERKKRGFSEETKKKMSQSRIGKKHAPEVIEKIKLSHANRKNQI